MVDREERDIIEGIAKELHGIRKALEVLVAIALAPASQGQSIGEV